MVFSGPGRHRRPTNADKAVAAVGVAGAGLALPLLTATGAHALPATTWDSVAQCTTGGDWSKAGDDGLYGGLGITLKNWVAYGGDQYAAQPDHATREQQIAVAEKLLSDQGPSAWSACATALTPPAPATPAPGDTPSAPATPPAAVSPSAVPSAPAVPTPTATAPTTAPTAPAPATTPAPLPPVVPVTPVVPAPPHLPAAPPQLPADGSYTVAPGDTLSGISDTYHLGGWPRLYAANQATVGADPNLIHPGEVLHLP